MPGLPFKQIGADIYLDPCETAVLALLGDGRKLLWRVCFGRVRVDADLVAPLAAEQLVDGDVVDLSDDVPERHLHRDDTAGLARDAAELRDFLKEEVDVERVLAHDAALENHGVLIVGHIADLAQTVHALIGIDANDRARTWPGFLDHGVAHVGDLQLGRVAVAVYMLQCGLGFGLLGQRSDEAAGEKAERGLENAAAVVLGVVADVHADLLRSE